MRLAMPQSTKHALFDCRFCLGMRKGDTNPEILIVVQLTWTLELEPLPEAPFFAPNMG